MPLQTDKVPSRWGAIVKTLSNKKAMDVAFMKHRWEMENKAQELAGEERKQEIAGQYHLKSQSEKDKVDNTPEKQAAAAAMQWARDQNLLLQTPEEQQQFQTAYNMFLHQFTGGSKGAMAAATGQMPEIAVEEPKQNPIASVGSFLWNNSLPGKVTNVIRAGSKQLSPNNVPEGTKARNKKTGEVLIRRNGKWVKE